MNSGLAGFVGQLTRLDCGRPLTGSSSGALPCLAGHWLGVIDGFSLLIV